MIEVTEFTKEIGGRQVRASVIPATAALGLEADIVSLFGPALFQAVMASKSDGADVGAAALQRLAVGVSPEKIIGFVTTVMKWVMIDGERVNLDKHFRGRNREVWEVMFFVLKENFHDFFPESLFSSLKEKAVEKLSQSSPQI